MNATLTALLIEPQASHRDRLKTALLSNIESSRLFCAPDLQEAWRILLETDRFDVMLVRVQRGDKALLEFVRRAKRTAASQDAAFIAVVGREQLSALVEDDLRELFDGVLTSPFSAESLAESLALAQALSGERRLARVGRTIELLVIEIRAQLSQVARHLSAGRPARIGRMVLTEMCSPLHDLPGEELQHYYNFLIDHFAKPCLLARATPLSGIGYRGASERVRAVMSRNAARRLRFALEAQPGEMRYVENGG